MSRCSKAIHHLIAREISTPLLTAAIPAGLFRLLGLITSGFDQPGMKMPTWIVSSMLAIQNLGMISMAIVILVRFDHGSRKLMFLTLGRPQAWQRYTLFLSIASLLLFELFTSLSTAFAGAEFFLVLAAPAFIAYMAFNRVAFSGIVRMGPQQPKN